MINEQWILTYKLESQKNKKNCFAKLYDTFAEAETEKNRIWKEGVFGEKVIEAEIFKGRK
jgi:hypothetical protein